MAGRSLLLGYLGLWVFGIAFGLIEAAVVVYLREIIGPLKTELFPVLSIGTPLEHWVLSVERYREVATLVVMLAPAMLYGNRIFERVVAYAIVFGLWDLAYYAFLYIILEWPTSLLTYDVLFLLPTLWVAPVICPVLVSLALAGFGSQAAIVVPALNDPGLIGLVLYHAYAVFDSTQVLMASKSVPLTLR